MAKGLTNPRGTADILPAETAAWQELERTARTQLARYGYREIRTPFFEETELFARSVGSTSDIVQKQMLNLASQGESSDARDMASSKLSLRPEGTAAIVRSYIQHRLDRTERLSKMYYIGPMFRGERPQKGRLRQFHQIGVEAIGPDTANPYLDAETIALCVELLKSFGLKDFELKINTLGTPQDKDALAKTLLKQLSPQLDRLCPDCRDRCERNVFRVLDCKKASCRELIHGLNVGYDHLVPESREYYEQVKSALNLLGVMFQEDPYLVRGLDYYTHTVFEVSCPSLGAQDAVGAGGRYNTLVRQLGGPQADATGFALGMERILLACEEKRSIPCVLDAFFIVLGDAAAPKAVQLLQRLRFGNVMTDMSFVGGSMKSQMRQADKAGARYVLILGEEELACGTVTLKNMTSGEQQDISLENMDALIAELNPQK
ncbi:MAG: histidine--tRNA ligase [Candidatus Omnitrophota bacterium]